MLTPKPPIKVSDVSELASQVQPTDLLVGLRLDAVAPASQNVVWTAQTIADYLKGTNYSDEQAITAVLNALGRGLKGPFVVGSPNEVKAGEWWLSSDGLYEARVNMTTSAAPVNGPNWLLLVRFGEVTAAQLQALSDRVSALETNKANVGDSYTTLASDARYQLKGASAPGSGTDSPLTFTPNSFTYSAATPSVALSANTYDVLWVALDSGLSLQLLRGQYTVAAGFLTIAAGVGLPDGTHVYFKEVSGNVVTTGGSSAPTRYSFTNQSAVTITHNLGREVFAQVLSSTGADIEAQVERPDLNTLQLTFSQPLTGRVLVF